MRERTRIILLSAVGGGTAFLFAGLMFYAGFTNQSAFAVIARAVGRGPATLSAADENVTYGSSVTIVPGQSVTFEDGAVVTLTSIEDSRCPKGQQCLWAGELTVMLDVRHGSKSSTKGAVSQLKLGQMTSTAAAAPPYAFTLLGIEQIESDTMAVTFQVALQ